MTVAISRMIDRVGQVLGGRYRLIAPIGTGASASVYLADDVTLRRRVAVKILHDALADDAAFLKRFRAEARAAAALNHPHIMSVFDWGQGDVPFLVTEYLGGGSLRSMLDLGRRLSLSQTLLVGLEAGRGLEYAHRRGFVHRDIKPANLLFDEDGRLRIADFGLARALAEAAWTEPMGAVLGTARYASPEQARGAPLDGKSDVYSLGLVLIEAATGDVPFTSDTTLGTLMGRVDNDVPVADALGPLKDALELAGRPDPADRPDAGAFVDLLMAAAGELDRPEPLPLAGAMPTDLDDLDERDPTTEYVAERKAVAEIEPEIMLAPPGTTTDGIQILHEGEGQPETRRIDRDSGDGEARPSRRERRQAEKLAKAEARTERADAVATTRRRWPKVLAVLVVLALLATGGWGYWYTQVREVTYAAPTLVGENILLLDDPGGGRFVIERSDTFQDGTFPGQILAQDPPPGTHLLDGDTIAITVSLGPPLVPMPTDLVGLPLTEAKAKIEAAELTVGAVTSTFDEEIPADVVMELGAPFAAEVPKGTEVPLVVSAGPAPRTIPQGLVGASADDAAAELRALGLEVSRVTESSETAPVGEVLRVQPGSGAQVPRGSTVELVVSSGPPTLPVPDVKGKSAAEAAQILQSQGFVVSGTQGSPANPVTGTNPAAGTVVRRGSSVTIITS